MGTFELYYPRYSDIDARQTALATGFAELISTQLASFELERQEDLSARMELRALQSQVDPHFLFNTIGTIALQSQVDPHFLFNTIGTIVSLVRTEPEKARSLLIDFSNYYRQTLSNSDALTSLENLENCIKHAMREVEPLSIKLSSLETDDGIQIVVEDDGIGMSEERLAHLLDLIGEPHEPEGTALPSAR